MLRREPIGYRYWCVQRTRYGWRQIGPETILIVDDFGNLVMTGAIEC